MFFCKKKRQIRPAYGTVSSSPERGSARFADLGPSVLYGLIVMLVVGKPFRWKDWW